MGSESRGIGIDVNQTSDSQMFDGVQIFFEWWPRVCAATSLVACVFSILAAALAEEGPFLQRVFAMACLSTAAQMIALLSSLRFHAEDRFESSDCQSRAGLIAFFQLAAICWMAAGFHASYVIIVKKVKPAVILPSTDAIELKAEVRNPLFESSPSRKAGRGRRGRRGGNSSSPMASMRQSMETFQNPLDEDELEEPLSPKEGSNSATPGIEGSTDAVKVSDGLNFAKLWLRYHFFCWGTPLVLVATLFLSQELDSIKNLEEAEPSLKNQGAPVFGYKVVASTRWCGVTTARPVTVFLLYYFPLILMMYVMAAFYHFCYDTVKTQKEMLLAIDAVASRRESAVILAQNTRDTFDTHHHVTTVLQTMMLLTSICTLPSCIFDIFTIAIDTGDKVIITGDKMHLIFSPLFGVFLFVSLESGFNLHSVYIQAVIRRLRACGCKCCASPKKYQYVDDDEEYSCGRNCMGYIPKAVVIIGEVLIFSLWGMVIWFPLQILKKDVKSLSRQMRICVLYMLLLLFPTLSFLHWVPEWFDSMGDTQETRKVQIGSTVLTTYLAVMFATVRAALGRLSARSVSL